MVARDGFVHRQRQVDEQLAEEEPAAGLAVEQQGVLADPAESRLLGQRLFQHRRAVDKGAMAERTDHRLNALGQLLQTLAHQLVVVAAQRIARHVGLFGIGQAPGHLGVAGQVIHAHGNHPQGAFHQFGWPRALVAVGGHVVHFALIAGGQPFVQAPFVLVQLDVGDAHLLEAQLAAPVLDGLRELSGIGKGDGHGGTAG